MPASSLESAVETAEDLQDVTSEPSTEIENAPGVPSLDEAINSALGEESDEEAAPASGEQDPQEPASEAPEEDELSEEEKKHFSERAQSRFRDLVAAKKSAEGKATEFQQELDSLKPKAEQMDQLVGYMREHEISPEHLNNALGLTSLINSGQYDKAIPALENLLAQVRGWAGDVLPPDLQERVRLGYLTEADAKDLNRARTSEKNVRERSERDRQKAAEERRQSEIQTAVTQAVTTADQWAKEQAASDPDWNLKRDHVTQRMELELRRLGPEGYPRTPEAARTLLGKVKEEVEAGLKKFRPAPKAIQTATGGNVSPRSKAKPESLMDAVNGALAAGE